MDTELLLLISLVRMYTITYKGIFDELYPGVKKYKVQDGNFFEMGTSKEAFGAP